MLQRMDEYGLVLNLEKSHFFQRKVTFLGLEFSADGYRPSGDYMPKVDAFVPPKTRKGIQAFMGLAGYYRQHVPRFADIAEPLTRLT